MCISTSTSFGPFGAWIVNYSCGVWKRYCCVLSLTIFVFAVSHDLLIHCSHKWQSIILNTWLFSYGEKQLSNDESLVKTDQFHGCVRIGGVFTNAGPKTLECRIKGIKR